MTIYSQPRVRSSKKASSSASSSAKMDDSKPYRKQSLLNNQRSRTGTISLQDRDSVDTKSPWSRISLLPQPIQQQQQPTTRIQSSTTNPTHQTTSMNHNTTTTTAPTHTHPTTAPTTTLRRTTSKTKVIFPSKDLSKWSQITNGGTFAHSISNLLEKSNHKLQLKELSPSGQVHFVNMMNRDVKLMQTIELYTSLTPNKFTLAYRLKINMQNGTLTQFTMSNQPQSFQTTSNTTPANQQNGVRHGWALFQVSKEKASESSCLFPNKLIEVAILL